jgi:hypothetical protein
MSHLEPSIRVMVPGGITRFDAFLELWNNVNSLPLKKMQLVDCMGLMQTRLCI